MILTGSLLFLPKKLLPFLAAAKVFEEMIIQKRKGIKKRENMIFFKVKGDFMIKIIP
jgi:hypothetical protein